MSFKTNQIVEAPYDAVVIVEGTTVFARDKTGKIIASGTAGVDDLTVAQAGADALSSGEVLLVHPTVASAGIAPPSGVVLTTTDPGVYNVKAFGAVGDGVTDDAAAIQAAIDMAGASSGDLIVVGASITTSTVILPPGTYRTMATLNIPTGVILEGHGYPCTIINYEGSGDAIATPTGSNNHGIQLRDFTLRDVLGTGAKGINFTNCIRGCEMERLWVEGFLTNYYVKQGQTTHLERCISYAARQDGLEVDGAPALRVLGGRYETSGRHGIYVANTTVDTEGIYIDGVAAQSNQEGGIVFSDVQTAHVKHCFIEANNQNGATTYAALHAVMQNSGGSPNGFISINDCFINLGSGGVGKAAIFVDYLKNGVVTGVHAQSQAVGLHIGANIEALHHEGNTWAVTTTRVRTDATNAFITKQEGFRPPIITAKDMDTVGDQSVFDGLIAAAKTFGGYVGSDLRYVSAGIWNAQPALQGGGAGTSNALQINPFAGDVSLALSPNAKTRIGALRFETQLTGSNITPNQKTGYVGVSCSGGVRTVTLTNITHATGRVVIIGKTDGTSNRLRITPSSGLIDGESAFDLTAPYEHIVLVSDGADWHTTLGKRVSVVNKTTSTSLLPTEQVTLGSPGASTQTYTLPTAVGNSGLTMTIKKVDAAAGFITVDGNGTETIDGALTYDIQNQYESITVVSDGANWVVI